MKTPSKESFDVTEFTIEEYEETFSKNELVKVLKLHDYNSVGHTRVTQNTKVELEGYCISGTCSNCSGISCAKLTVPTELVPQQAPQSEDVMTLEDEEQSLQQIKEWVWDWHVERGLQGCGSGMDFDDIFHAINDYSLPIKAKSDQLQAELSEYKSGLKQSHGDRDELHKKLEQVKAERDAMREALHEIIKYEPNTHESIQMKHMTEKALQSTKQ